MFEQDEPVLERVVDELRAPVRINPELDARVMAQIAREREESVFTRGLRWVTEPRLVAVTPLKAFAMAAGLLLVVSLARGTRGGADAVPTATAKVAGVHQAASPDTTVIQFVFVAPSASSVSLVGDFNGWDAARTQLRPAESGGMWSVSLPLPPGRHRYAFIVDGKQWVPDPAAPRAVEDDFGSPNSVVTVGEKTT